MVDNPIDVEAFRAFESRGWEAKAVAYHESFTAITNRAIDSLLNAVGVHSGMRLLDVGTGAGFAASAAASLGADAIGIDGTAAMVELASSLHPEVEFRQADAEHLPFADATFEAVVSNFVLPHLPRPRAAVDEMVRVLTREGRLALSIWDVPARNRLFGIMADAVQHAAASPPPDVPAGPPTSSHYGTSELTELFQTAGLSDVNVRSFEFRYRLRNSDELWAAMTEGTVRAAATVHGQPPSLQRDIRVAFDALASVYAVGGELEIPVSFKIAVAGKDPETRSTV
jgi:SAM-dependent methyltransferase